ncbi:MAG: aromatic ring-hydroxylating dioxygenase subunit alpha [Oculatellaceae cyanobacterium Prado106]|jgi:phenylpropionate dioxygenase-like ring-hydroxylating dioxygenase large terminal subunit|nr:aromatic ring-hydroxylating dioxygenase subunit alpha [Oculatellaceae cyanobacterium Prado106]
MVSPDSIPSQLQRSFLAGALYTDADLLPLEQQHIFRQTWLYVGQAEDLMRSSTVRAIEVAGTSVLITRDQDSTLRAFHNLCPHRAALFCREPGAYALKHLVCPYHAWTYSLAGNLVGVPQEERFSEDFCRSDYGLTPVRLEQWQDFVFLCFSQTAPSLMEYLGRIPTMLNRHVTAQTRLLLNLHYSVQCNWKVYHDNTLCDYHVAIAHRNTLDPVQGPVDRYEYEFDEFVNLLYTPTTKEWRSQNPILAGLDERGREGFFTFGIFPNVHLLGLPNGLVVWLRIDPVTVNHCRLNLEIYGVPELSPPIDELSRDFAALTQEDIVITEGVQKGYASGMYRPGPANQLEDRIVHQQRLIWKYLQTGLQGDRLTVLNEMKALK